MKRGRQGQLNLKWLPSKLGPPPEGTLAQLNREREGPGTIRESSAKKEVAAAKEDLQDSPGTLNVTTKLSTKPKA